MIERPQEKIYPKQSCFPLAPRTIALPAGARGCVFFYWDSLPESQDFWQLVDEVNDRRQAEERLVQQQRLQAAKKRKLLDARLPDARLWENFQQELAETKHATPALENWLKIKAANLGKKKAQTRPSPQEPPAPEYK